MSGIEEALEAAKADMNRKQANLLVYIRPKKTASGWGAEFVGDGAVDAISNVDAADKHLEQVMKDREAFLKLTGGEPTLSGLLDRLSRARRIVNDAELDARNAVERAIRNHAALNVREAEALPEVQSAFDKRDRVRSEKSPIISDLEGRVKEAKKILARY
jgi:hypothetical protein